MDDLIRRQGVIDYVLEHGFYCDTEADKEYTAELIRTVFPSVDAVEVVRCRDCKHLFEDNGCPLRYFRTHLEDDFCSYGERRADMRGEQDE